MIPNFVARERRVQPGSNNPNHQTPNQHTSNTLNKIFLRRGDKHQQTVHNHPKKRIKQHPPQKNQTTHPNNSNNKHTLKHPQTKIRTSMTTPLAPALALQQALLRWLGQQRLQEPQEPPRQCVFVGEQKCKCRKHPKAFEDVIYRGWQNTSSNIQTHPQTKPFWVAKPFWR